MTKILNKAGTKLYYNAYEVRNWRFDKNAKRTLISSGLMIAGAITLVQVLKADNNKHGKPR